MEILPNGTRIYFRARNPNPLFTEWLKYWLEEAERKESMKKMALAKALESLEKYPLVLHSGRDCAILEGFGSSICAMIDKQLEAFRSSHPNKVPSEQEIEKKEKSVIFDLHGVLEQEKQKKHNPIEDFKKLDDTLEALLNGGNTDFDDLANVIDDLEKDPWTKHKRALRAGQFKIILLVDTQETAG